MLLHCGGGVLQRDRKIITHMDIVTYRFNCLVKTKLAKLLFQANLKQIRGSALKFIPPWLQ